MNHPNNSQLKHLGSGYYVVERSEDERRGRYFLTEERLNSILWDIASASPFVAEEIGKRYRESRLGPATG